MLPLVVLNNLMFVCVCVCVFVCVLYFEYDFA